MFKTSQEFVGWRAKELQVAKLQRSAIVFSPHEDDETLSCGGTIIRKRQAGADVQVIFLTDGSRSHPDLMSEQDMAGIRADEARRACRLLGLSDENICFLNHKDGELAQSQERAIADVLNVLRLYEPEELFIPYHKEPHIWSLDHLATNRIVLQALKVWNKPVTVYEYPTWLWYDQPLAFLKGGKQFLVALKQRAASRYYLLKDFCCSVYIRDVWDIKREALAQYKSQMDPFISDPEWNTLRDLAGGDFLECFFQENEFFSVKTIGKSKGRVRFVGYFLCRSVCGTSFCFHGQLNPKKGILKFREKRVN